MCWEYPGSWPLWFTATRRPESAGSWWDRPAIERGIVDRDSFIEALNEDLQTEFQSIVQYVQHTAAITGPQYLSTVDELKIHLGQELQHAQILAEQISFRGGPPA